MEQLRGFEFQVDSTAILSEAKTTLRQQIANNVLQEIVQLAKERGHEICLLHRITQICNLQKFHGHTVKAGWVDIIQIRETAPRHRFLGSFYL